MVHRTIIAWHIPLLYNRSIMREITFLERLAENLVEGGFARALKPKLQPVQMAKALAREMATTQMVGPHGPMVANHYSVLLNSTDFAQFAGFQVNLERELAGYLRGYAARRGLRPIRAITVSMEEASDVRLGRIRTDAVMLDSPLPRAEPFAGFQRGDLTMEMPIVTASPTLPAPQQCPAMLISASGEQMLITQASTTIGRSIENDVILESRSVSRHHAQIRWEADRYLLEDVESTNGTFASGQKVRHHVLSDGEEISFGGILFVFHMARR
jgi:hypothetical protein